MKIQHAAQNQYNSMRLLQVERISSNFGPSISACNDGLVNLPLKLGEVLA